MLESSPGNYQAIITVPKLGTAHDKGVGNRLSDALNRQYGDPKLSGAIHPHRAPGYENRKPKHQREDGSYPEVRLLKAERRECIKALALSSQIDAEYQRRQKDEGRDWNDYAQRTARYAYSAAGDRQAADLGKYQQQWEKLEGREPQWQQEQAKAQEIESDNSPGMSP